MKMADAVPYDLEVSHQVLSRPSPISLVSDQILAHTVQNLKLSELGTLLCGKLSRALVLHMLSWDNSKHAGRFLHH